MDKPAKEHRYDDAVNAGTLRLTHGSRLTQAAACALIINPKRIRQWQHEAQTSLPADPTQEAGVHRFWIVNRKF